MDSSDRPVKTENSASSVRLTKKNGKTLETDAARFAASRRAAVDGLSNLTGHKLREG